GDCVPQDARRKRAERLSPLDLPIQDLLHVCPSGITQDAAVPQSPRTPLHSALEPAHNQALADPLSHLAAEVHVARNPADTDPSRIELSGVPRKQTLNVLAAVLRAEKCAPHGLRPPACYRRPNVSSSANSTAGVSRSGRDVDVAKWRLYNDLAICYAVHGTAAG